MRKDTLGLKHELPPKRRMMLTVLSFLLPLALWAAVSYIPWLWHPQVHITDAGEVESFSEGMELPRKDLKPRREFAKIMTAPWGGGTCTVHRNGRLRSSSTTDQPDRQR